MTLGKLLVLIAFFTPLPSYGGPGGCEDAITAAALKAYSIPNACNPLDPACGELNLAKAKNRAKIAGMSRSEFEACKKTALALCPEFARLAAQGVSRADAWEKAMFGCSPPPPDDIPPSTFFPCVCLKAEKNPVMIKNSPPPPTPEPVQQN